MSKTFYIYDPGHIPNVAEHVRHQVEAGKPQVVKCAAYDDKRSSQQNDFYQKLVREFANYSGEQDMEYWKEYFRYKFLGSRIVNVDGVTKEPPISTRDLTVDEFANYLDKIQGYLATEHGFVLPPEERPR